MSLCTYLWNPTKQTLVSVNLRKFSCWSCGNKNELDTYTDLFCSNCKVLQKPPKSESYFRILGVKETFEIDQSKLTKKYKELQKQLHPDKYANRMKEEQKISAQYSSLVNEAYKTLLEPLSRGIYLLRLRGKEIPENTEVDQDFLTKIMEKNEEVENADTKEEIMKLYKENKRLIELLEMKINFAFYEGDLRSVSNLLTRMKYYTSIDNQLKTSIRNKGIII